jgi:hypothetical protein
MFSCICSHRENLVNPLQSPTTLANGAKIQDNTRGAKAISAQRKTDFSVTMRFVLARPYAGWRVAE